MRQTFAVLVLIGGAVAFAPERAAAGPVEWNYTVGTDTDAMSGGWVYFGESNKTTFDPATGTETVTPYLVLSNISRGSVGTASGSSAINVLSLSQTNLQAYAADDPWAITRPGVFTLTATITDAASGQSRQVQYDLFGTGVMFVPTGTGVVSLSLLDTQTDDFYLGGNHYTARAVTRESESGAYLDLAVTAVPGVPEPGTLALAGAGVGGLWMVRRLRRAVAGGK